MTDWLTDITLVGKGVTLRPMQPGDADALVVAASDGALWGLTFTSVPSEATIGAYMQAAFDMRDAGTAHPFVVVHQDTGQIIGSTRYCNADPAHKRVEIGYTWYAKSHQRTAVNSECKRLLLDHAFGALGCIRVELRTHHENKRSQAAIERIGGKLDGILRHHMIMPDGSLRDTYVYSILKDEW